MKKFNSVAALAVLSIVTAAPAAALCTSATINPSAVSRILPRMTAAAISDVLGCTPTELPSTPGTQGAQILAWGLNEGSLKKQVAVQFDYAGAATIARYQEIPLQPVGVTSNDNDDSAKKAALLAMLLFARGVSSGTSGLPSGCTPATINPGAVQSIRPHMSPAAVSAVLGCAPTEIFRDSLQIWYWGIPQVGMSKIHVAVTFDASGALSAQYQVIATAPKVPPICNGALRVEPPTTIGNWVPGACP